MSNNIAQMNSKVQALLSQVFQISVADSQEMSQVALFLYPFCPEESAYYAVLTDVLLQPSRGDLGDYYRTALKKLLQSQGCIFCSTTGSGYTPVKFDGLGILKRHTFNENQHFVQIKDMNFADVGAIIQQDMEFNGVCFAKKGMWHATKSVMGKAGSLLGAAALATAASPTVRGAVSTAGEYVGRTMKSAKGVAADTAVFTKNAFHDIAAIPNARYQKMKNEYRKKQNTPTYDEVLRISDTCSTNLHNLQTKIAEDKKNFRIDGKLKCLVDIFEQCRMYECLKVRMDPANDLDSMPVVANVGIGLKILEDVFHELQSENNGVVESVVEDDRWMYMNSASRTLFEVAVQLPRESANDALKRLVTIEDGIQSYLKRVHGKNIIDYAIDMEAYSHGSSCYLSRIGAGGLCFLQTLPYFQLFECDGSQSQWKEVFRNTNIKEGPGFDMSHLRSSPELKNEIEGRGSLVVQFDEDHSFGVDEDPHVDAGFLDIEYGFEFEQLPLRPFSLITKLSHIVDNIEAVNKFEEGLERDYLMLSITNLCTFDELWAWIGENTSVTLKLDLHSFVTERLLKFNANKTPVPCDQLTHAIQEHIRKSPESVEAILCYGTESDPEGVMKAKVAIVQTFVEQMTYLEKLAIHRTGGARKKRYAGNKLEYQLPKLTKLQCDSAVSQLLNYILIEAKRQYRHNFNSKHGITNSENTTSFGGVSTRRSGSAEFAAGLPDLPRKRKSKSTKSTSVKEAKPHTDPDPGSTIASVDSTDSTISTDTKAVDEKGSGQNKPVPKKHQQVAAQKSEVTEKRSNKQPSNNPTESNLTPRQLRLKQREARQRDSQEIKQKDESMSTSEVVESSSPLDVPPRCKAKNVDMEQWIKEHPACEEKDFRKMSLKVHPDKNKDCDKEANEKFQKLKTHCEASTDRSLAIVKHKSEGKQQQQGSSESSASVTSSHDNTTSNTQGEDSRGSDDPAAPDSAGAASPSTDEDDSPAGSVLLEGNVNVDTEAKCVMDEILKLDKYDISQLVHLGADCEYYLDCEPTKSKHSACARNNSRVDMSKWAPLVAVVVRQKEKDTKPAKYKDMTPLQAYEKDWINSLIRGIVNCKGDTSTCALQNMVECLIYAAEDLGDYLHSNALHAYMRKEIESRLIRNPTLRS